MQSGSPFWFNLVVALLFFGGLFAIGFFVYEHRWKVLRRFAERYRLDFSEWGTTRVLFPSEQAIKRRGLLIRSVPQVRWSIRGETEGIEVCLYQMVLRTGPSSDPRSQAWGYPLLIGRFVWDELDLPKTLIRPRSVLGKIRKRTFRIVDTPLERHPLDIDFAITTDSVEEFIESFDSDASRLIGKSKHRTFEGLANAFYLVERHSQVRFLLLTERFLDRFLHDGLALAKALAQER